MANESFSHPANFSAAPLTRKAGPPGGRLLAVATAVVFVISSVFPVVAAGVRDRELWPKWWGVLDVGIAFVLAILAFAVMAVPYGKVDKQAGDACYRAYRVLIHAIFVVLVVFFLFGDRIVWSNCLTGLAWRFWLLLYGLPAWLAVAGIPEKCIKSRLAGSNE
jgi:hypothetical protein